MLTEWDDYFIHQTSDPLNRVEGDDPRWFDRLFFCTYDPGGPFLMALGLGTYPNAGVMDGYVCAVHKDTQYNLRVSRHLHNDRAHMVVGPFALHILAPQDRWSLKLDENDFGLAFDLLFQRRHPPYLVKKIAFPGEKGAEVTQSHYVQHGKYRGSLTVGQAHLPVQGLPGVRDRSWGVRSPRRGQAIHFWVHAQFPRFSLSCIYNETREGTPAYLDGALFYDDSRIDPIVDLKHRVKFPTPSMEHSEAELRLLTASGDDIHLRSRQLLRGAYLAGGWGAGHGVDQGEYHVDGEKWDLSDPALINSLPFALYEQLAEFRLGQEVGVGNFEAGFSRSPAYRYRSTW